LSVDLFFTLFVFVFGRTVGLNIRFRPNSDNHIFGTALIYIYLILGQTLGNDIRKTLNISPNTKLIQISRNFKSHTNKVSHKRDNEMSILVGILVHIVKLTFFNKLD